MHCLMLQKTGTVMSEKCYMTKSNSMRTTMVIFPTDQAKYDINVSSFLWNAHHAFNNIDLIKVNNVIVKPVGRVIMTRKRNTFFMNTVQYALLYNLNKGLGLNITFDYIYFGFGNLHKCFVGYLTVHSKDSKFHYCGIYAAMVNYPDSSQVNLTLKAQIHTMFNVSISFSVIDSGIIQSHSSSKYTQVQPTWSLYFPKRMVSLQKIHIQVDRLYSLKIKLNLSTFVSVEIYDGPGTLSPKVHIGQYTDVNTFQCVLYSFHRHKRTVKTKLNQIMYSSKSLTQSEKVDVKPDSLETLHYLTGICTGNSDVCLFKFSTNASYYVNVSISYFLYKGRDNLHCFFAGLTSYVPNYNKVNKMSQICFTNNIFYRHQNIYSSNSDILLVVYSYKEYGSLNINFVISTTMCKAISINICSLTFLCKSSSQALCTHFLQKTKVLNNVKSTIDKKLEYDSSFFQEKPLNPSYFKFQINTSECIIMQINHDVHELTNYESNTFNMRFDTIALIFCGVDEFRYLAQDEVNDVNMVNENIVHFNVSGFIQGR